MNDRAHESPVMRIMQSAQAASLQLAADPHVIGFYEPTVSNLSNHKIMKACKRFPDLNRSRALN
jgi:hypothetical protein